jgi:hypothetical protein
MKICRKKPSAFHSSRYSILSLRPSTVTNEQKTMIPMKIWAANNHYSVKQVRTLIQKKLVLAKKHKNRWYVVAACDLSQYQ